MIKVTKRTILVTAIVVVVVVVAGYFWHRHTEKPVAHTTSKQQSAQSNFKSGGNHENSTNSGVTQGSATDNKGDKSIAQSGAGVSSASGIVTVVSPAQNGTLASGDTVRGTATGVPQVQYRVIDNDVGVVAQGTLSVVNGTFSGTLQFRAHATMGRLDVYTLNNQGQETNEVQMPIGMEP